MARIASTYFLNPSADATMGNALGHRVPSRAEVNDLWASKTATITGEKPPGRCG